MSAAPDAASFDRLFCINALHHFEDPAAFVVEARRVLRPGGTLLTIGRDPHTGLDRWWVYDYFPSTLVADRVRFQSAATIRERLEMVGFLEAKTEVAQTCRSMCRSMSRWSAGFSIEARNHNC